MNYSNLSIDQAPSIGIPLRFFLTAPLFGLTAVMALFIQGPEFLQQQWFNQTIASVHLLTLGFITMTMMGALFQLLPVLAGASIYRAEVSSTLVHGVFASGVILFTLGLYTNRPLLIQLGLSVLLPGLLLFLILASISLVQSGSRHASVTGMQLSIASLWVSLVMGGWLAAGHGFESVMLARQFTYVHVAWAAVGWISLMIISVAYQVIPMFQVTQEYPQVIKRSLSPLIFGLLLLWSGLTLAGYNSRWLNTLILALICLLLIVFVSITLHLLYQRKKRLADASLYFWLVGLVSLALSLLTVFYTQITHTPHLLLAGIIFIPGFVMSIINAMLYKIVPFLVWLHLMQRQKSTEAGISSIPSMYEIIPPAKAYRQLYLHLFAISLLTLSIFFAEFFFYPALLLLAADWLYLQTQLLLALRVYLRHRR